MRNVCAVTLLLVVACATGDGALDPKIAIQTVKVPEARTPRADWFTTVLELAITNPRSETITVDRVQIASVSVGTYTIEPVNERPHKEIAPGATETIRLWAQMQVQPTASEGLDPILFRGSAEFLAASGGFRKTFTYQVNPSSLR